MQVKLAAAVVRVITMKLVKAAADAAATIIMKKAAVDAADTITMKKAVADAVVMKKTLVISAEKTTKVAAGVAAANFPLNR